MKNYAVLEGMKRSQRTVLDCAFNKGYEQGYHDGKLDGEAEKIEKLEKQFDDEKKAEYKRGYADGKKEVAAELNFEKGYDKGYEDGKKLNMNDAYEVGKKDGQKAERMLLHEPLKKDLEEAYQKGLKHGQELRAKEAECAEACGMKRAWEAARKILHMEQRDINKMMGGSDFGDINIIDELTPQEVIAKLDAWEKKQEQEQTEKVVCDKDCKNCIDHPNCDEAEWKLRRRGIVPAPPKEKQSEKSCENCDHYCGYDDKFKCDIKGVLCIERDRWTPKQKQVEKSCKTCSHTETGMPKNDDAQCEECHFDGSGNTLWQPKEKQDAPETNVGSIEVGDEVYQLDKNYTYIVTNTDDKIACFFSRTGHWGCRSISELHKTGRHFPIQEILDAMKNNSEENNDNDG